MKTKAYTISFNRRAQDVISNPPHLVTLAPNNAYIRSCQEGTTWVNLTVNAATKILALQKGFQALFMEQGNIFVEIKPEPVEVQGETITSTQAVRAHAFENLSTTIKFEGDAGKGQLIASKELDKPVYCLDFQIK
jgi:hypothetical protein